MAYTTINKHTDYFNTKLYTGTGSSNAITGVGHAPDLVWLKSRSAGWDHEWYDSVRGTGYSISSVTSNAQGSSPQGVTAFGSDGFNVGTRSGANQSSQTYAAWNWKAGTTGSGYTTGSGTYKTYNYSVNTTAGFSIIKYTGNGTSGHTIPHHLGVAPDVVFIKNLSDGEEWRCGHTSQSSNFSKGLHLSTNGSEWTQTGAFNDTAPSSTVFSVGNFNSTNGDGDNLIAYCFAPKTGYSKFGKYVGNGDASGTFVYTGFKPAFILIRRTDSGDNWMLHDNKREGYNPANDELMANLSNTEQAYDTIDLLSNGFKLRHTAGRSNNNGGTYIYMAFGQSLVGSNNVPCTAR